MTQEWNPLVVIPPLLPTFAVLGYQHRSRRKLSNTSKDRQRRRGVAKSEKEIERGWIYLWFGIVGRENGTDFRTEG
jgi:hypothetical protein